MSLSVMVGGGENVTPEVQAQSPLVTEILESLVGKVTLANATPEAILEGYSAYVGQQLVQGILPNKNRKIRYGKVTSTASYFTLNFELAPDDEIMTDETGKYFAPKDVYIISPVFDNSVWFASLADGLRAVGRDATGAFSSLIPMGISLIKSAYGNVIGYTMSYVPAGSNKPMMFVSGREYTWIAIWEE